MQRRWRCGHERTEENTCRQPHEKCRTCQNARWRRHATTPKGLFNTAQKSLNQRIKHHTQQLEALTSWLA